MNLTVKHVAAVIAMTLILYSESTFAQLPGWNYRSPITITETDGVSKTDYPVRIIIKTRNLVNSGKVHKNGNDLRFADSCASNVLNHYIESGVGTDTTIVWVRLPSLPANSSVDLFMYYGNSTAASGSKAGKTFDNPYITKSASQTLSGYKVYDYVLIKSTDTLFIKAGSKLTIDSARWVVINGHIKGEGRGSQPSSTNFADGTGTGKGTASTGSNAGAGGGGYGGAGGDGGYDSGDDRGLGGKTYGTEMKDDIAMGSSGGNGSGPGAAGGGCLEINSDFLLVNGVINMNGDSATSASSGGQLGGGGSGGGVKISGHRVIVNGSVTADGGAGGDGAGTANDSGGGGGGGRIKIFYDEFLRMNGTTSAQGGDGGIYGSAATGQDGLAGTIYTADTTTGTKPDSVTNKLGTEQAMIFSATSSDADLVGCEDDTVTVTALSGFKNYNFYFNGSLVTQTTSNSHDFYLNSSGDVLKVTVAYNTCIDLVDSFVFGVFPKPTINFVGGDSVLCVGDSTAIKVNGAKEYKWSHGLGTDKEVNVKPTTTTTYYIDGISAKGCVGRDSFMVTVNQLPVINVVGDTTTCDGDTVMLVAQGADTYSWSSGQSVDTIRVVPKDSFTLFSVTGVDNNSCVGTGKHRLTSFELPKVETTGEKDYCEGDSFKITASGAATYTWSTGQGTAEINGVATKSQKFTVTGTNIYGCSLVKNHRINVTERPVMTITGDTLICEGAQARMEANDVTIYNWSDGQKGKIVRVEPTKKTTYSVIGIDILGCRDTAYHTVDIYEVNVAVSAVTGGVTADLSDATSYQWYDCDDAFAEISGATDQTYIVPENGDGNFAVIVDDGTCADTSACIAGTFVGIDENHWVRQVKLYPNPSNGMFYLAANNVIDPINCRIYSATGQLIEILRFTGNTQIDLSDQPAGIYTILLESNNETGQLTLVKK